MKDQYCPHKGCGQSDSACILAAESTWHSYLVSSHVNDSRRVDCPDLKEKDHAVSKRLLPSACRSSSCMLCLCTFRLLNLALCASQCYRLLCVQTIFSPADSKSASILPREEFVGPVQKSPISRHALTPSQEQNCLLLDQASLHTRSMLLHCNCSGRVTICRKLQLLIASL